ncbi:hypothetical protein ABBQ38_012067 [Trebouxia sp. C0009 RCD-2024]
MVSRAEVYPLPPEAAQGNLLFVQFYASEGEPTATCDPRQDLDLRHLVWGRVERKAQGRKTCWQPHCAVVEAQAAVQQVWTDVCVVETRQQNHFLVNLWPPTDISPATIPSPEDHQQA